MLEVKRLGGLNLEGVYDQALFLAPKVYTLNIKNGKIINIKGLTKEATNLNNISIDTLEMLLNKVQNLAFNLKKWFKNIDRAYIHNLDQIYTLKVTGNKRELVYNTAGVLIETRPILIP
jgi:hypothetical protein